MTTERIPVVDLAAWAKDRERKAIEDTFCEWHKDPVRIARLWRFLDITDRTPLDTPLFIEAAASYQQEYEELRMWEGKS